MLEFFNVLALLDHVGSDRLAKEVHLFNPKRLH